MRIYFERTGGFMGRSIETDVDVSTLPPEEAQSLHQLIEATRFFELPTELDGHNGIDAFNYTLTVEEPDRKHTVHTSDINAPDEMQPLLRRLTLLARTHPAGRTLPKSVDDISVGQSNGETVVATAVPDTTPTSNGDNSSKVGTDDRHLEQTL